MNNSHGWTPERLAHTVPRQDRLLMDGFDRDGAHRRLSRGYRNGFSVCGVILAAFTEWRDDRSRYQSRRMAPGGKPAALVMG